MATKDSRTLEILLNGIDLSTSSNVQNGKHLVTLELICPRPAVASKSAVKPFKFTKGALDCAPMPWVKKIFLKESVEFRFGLYVRVSESVTAACIENFLRYLVGSAFGIGGDALEKTIGGYQGDLATIPMDYAKKKLTAAKDIRIVAEGAVDLMPSELEESSEIEIPLCTLRDVFKMEHGPRAANTPASRKLVRAEGTVIGKAKVQLNTLK